MKAFRVAALLISAVAAASTAQAQGRNRGNPPPQNEGERPPQKREKQFPIGASWVATSLNGRPFGGDRPAFMLDKQYRAKGFGGCNTFSATAYPLREQGFAVGPLAMTKRSCDKGVMETEREFLTALRTAQKWDIVGPTLVLQGLRGELRFERAL